MSETRFDRYDVPVVPGRNTAPPPMTTELIAGPESSTLWRATRLILAWVAIVAIVEIVIIMTLTLAAGVSVLSRLGDPVPLPSFSECVGEVCGD